MLNKSIYKVGLVSFGNIFNALMGFAFLAAAARNLDLKTFGVYALLTTLLVSVSRIIDFGTNSVFVAKSISENEGTIKDTFLSLKIILTAATFPIFIVALLLLHELNISILVVLMAGSVAYAINYTLFPIFQKDEKYFPLIVLNFLPALIKGIFAGLVLFSIVKLDLLLAVSIFSLSIFASAFLIFLLPKNYLKLKMSLDGTVELFKKSYPAGVSQIVAEWWPTISNAIAKTTGGFANVGIFSLASKISHIFALISLSIFTVLLPKNAVRKKQNLGYDFAETILIALIIVLAAIISIPVAKYFILRFLGIKFAASLTVLNILIISAALTSIHSFIENFFYIEQKTSYILLVNLGKLSVFLVLAAFLVPVFSLTGLAYSDLAASITAVALTVILINKSVRS